MTARWMLAGSLAMCGSGCGVRDVPPERAEAPAEPPSLGAPEIDALRHHIFDNLGLSKGMRVAEVGAGRGWFTFRMAEAIGSTGVVYPTDIDREAIAALEGGIGRLSPNAGRVEPQFCDSPRDTALDHLPERSVDLILIVDSMCVEDLSDRVEEQVTYLRSLRRILAADGRLVYHPDCRCGGQASAAASRRPFEQAGFKHSQEFPPLPAASASSPVCETERERERHRVVDVYRVSGF